MKMPFGAHRCSVPAEASVSLIAIALFDACMRKPHFSSASSIKPTIGTLVMARLRIELRLLLLAVYLKDCIKRDREMMCMDEAEVATLDSNIAPNRTQTDHENFN